MCRCGECFGCTAGRPADPDPPLGLCIECFRMRWIGEVVRTDPVVSGVCTQCIRERDERSYAAGVTGPDWADVEVQEEG